MVQFDQRRDFGEKINATFTFVTEQMRGLGLSLLYIVGPVALIGGIISGYGQMELLNTSPTVKSSDDLLRFYGQFFTGSRLIGVTFQLLAYVLTSLVTFCYIRLYRERRSEQPIGVNMIWTAVQPYIGSGVMLSVASAIMIGFGFLLLVLPGIYIAIALTLAPAILVFERQDVGQSISRSFRLVSGHWWSVFGLLFVISVIVSIMSLIFTLPAGIIGGLFGAGVLKDISIIGTLVTAVASVGGSILQGLSATATAFQYFSLVEEKEGTGLLEQIDSIGQVPTRPGMPVPGTPMARNRDDEGDY